MGCKDVPAFEARSTRDVGRSHPRLAREGTLDGIFGALGSFYAVNISTTETAVGNAAQVLWENVRNCSSDLFNHYCGCKPAIEIVNDEDLEESILAEVSAISSSIGLVGDDFGLSVVLIGTTESAERLFGEELDAADGYNELANQLVGRVKNGLLLYRIDSNIGLPMATSGKDLRFSGLEGERRGFVIRSMHGSFLAVASMQVAPGTNWNRTDPPEVAGEGSMLLF